MVVTTARGMTKVARAMVSGATRTTVTTVAMAMTVAMMSPNGDKDNKNGNSKNNNKEMMMVAWQRQQREVSVINPSETIMSGDIVVSQTPPLR